MHNYNFLEASRQRRQIKKPKGNGIKDGLVPGLVFMP
jgi:hypothetical protein